jgi:hypothetical protein
VRYGTLLLVAALALGTVLASSAGTAGAGSTTATGRDFASERTSEPGVNFKKRFRKRGRYKLICTVHPDEMRLRLRVRRAG